MTCFFTQNPLPLPFFVFYRVGFPPLFRKFFLKISPSREPSFSLTRPVRSSLDGGRGDIRVHDEVEIKIKISTASSEESCIVKILTLRF